MELGAGSREASEIRMFNHWAAGLRSGLLPRRVVLQHLKWAKNGRPNLEVGLMVLVRGARE